MLVPGITMTKKLLFVCALVLALAVAAMAADITGKWVMERPGRDGGPGMTSTFDLKADGAKLTGTYAMSFGEGGGGGFEPPPPTAISNGKIDGDKISFDVVMDFGGNSMTQKYEGVVAGSEIKFKMVMPGFGGGEPRTIEGVAKKK
jgi:hypothetical protein